MTFENERRCMDAAWDRIFGVFFDPNTYMIYDYLTGESLEEMKQHFPTPEEIAACSPNPCGWGTGMEDNTISTGIMMDAALVRYDLTGEECVRNDIKKLLESMIRCGTMAKTPGFIIRALAPADGTSYYIDSSRDQYTHWIYSALRYLKSSFCTKEEGEVLQGVLKKIGEKMDREALPEKCGALCREDGFPGLVSGMMMEGMSAHEFLRLPMFYLAVHAATGEQHWLEQYHRHREVLLTKTEDGLTLEEMGKHFFTYGLLQMQYSLRLLYDYETDKAYRERYLALMQKVAAYAPHYVEMIKQEPEICQRKEEPFVPWRSQRRMNYLFHGGRAYYTPADYNHAVFRPMRNCAEGMLIQCLCPDFPIPAWEQEAFREIVRTVDFSSAYSYWPVEFCGAWWLFEQSVTSGK